jgi:hypothetical protein
MTPWDRQGGAMHKKMKLRFSRNRRLWPHGRAVNPTGACPTRCALTGMIGLWADPKRLRGQVYSPRGAERSPSATAYGRPIGCAAGSERTTPIAAPAATARPLPRSSPAVFSCATRSTSASICRMPARPNRTAIARPSPLASPVITATRSLKSLMAMATQYLAFVLEEGGHAAEAAWGVSVHAIVARIARSL